MTPHMPPIAPLDIAQKVCRHPARQRRLIRQSIEHDRAVTVREVECLNCRKVGASELPVGSTGYGPTRWL